MANMNKHRDEWMFKAPKELKQALIRVRTERIRQGKDIEPKPFSRLGLAMSRHEQLLNDLIKADMPEEKRR